MHETADSVWGQTLDLLRPMFTENQFVKSCFATIRPLELNSERITVGVANEFSGLWLSENYRDVIEGALRATTGRHVKIVFQPVGTPPPEMPASASPRGSRAGTAHAPARSAARAAELPPLFDPRNTFDSFVVGNNNYAYAAALAVAQQPGRSYNPLFLIGATGLGKTHLLHAIGQYVHFHSKGARVTYGSCERFTNEFIEALQNAGLPRFRKRFRERDVLLIDDVQFLAGKERIQEEFFHTFNALHESGRQIVLTCDRPAADIQGLEPRLISRFEWGMVADLMPPDKETRMAILRKKGQAAGLDLSPEIVEFLAERIRTNVRRLEGALVRVVARIRIAQHPVTVDDVRDLLKDLLAEEVRVTLTPEVIMKRVAEYFELRVADLLGRRRPSHIALARQIAMYLARQLTDCSLSTIGESFGGRDHGTVLHACRQVKNRADTEENVRKSVAHLERLLRG